MLLENFKVESPQVQYDADSITSTYKYESTQLEQTGSSWVVRPTSSEYKFRTETRLPKLGYDLRKP